MRDQFRELCTYRPITISVTRSGAIVNLSSLTGADILLTARRLSDGTLLVDHEACTFATDGSDGQVQYTFTEAQLVAGGSGTYELQLEIHWTAEAAETVVLTDTVEIAEHYGTHP